MDFDNRELMIPSREQIFGTGKTAEDGSVIDVHAIGVLSDFAIALGAETDFFCCNDTFDKFYGFDDFPEKMERPGLYWLSSPSSLKTKDRLYNNVCAVNQIGSLVSYIGYCRNVGIRPATPFSSSNEVEEINGFPEVEYGEYPQYAVSTPMELKLTQAYKSGAMRKTGKTYAFDAIPPYDYNGTSFSFGILEEYVYNGKKFIQIGYRNKDSRILSNGKKYKKGDYVWIEVTPLKWYVYKEAQIMLCKNVITSGIRFNGDHPCWNSKGELLYEKSDIGNFLRYYLSKDIKPSEIFQETQKKQDTLENNEQQIGSSSVPVDNNSQVDTSKSPQTKVTPAQNSSSCTKINNSIRDFQKEKVTKENPYGLNFEKVSEEDIIKVAIKSGVAVFLHGPSSEGKSARVKQIDPDCVIIYLRNASPESLNGKSVYNSETGEMIDIKPTWLKKLEAKCETEPDKLHIVFFDEMTNALPSIQGIAFNIVLDREVNGMWKLPENARIVAAGNEMKDSLSANQLAEPLFNRFAHVYIKTTPEKWLEWASENNIHPAICSYIAYTKGRALRSKYDGEKPNADPRKWEMASKMLYETGNPEVLRSLVGEDITREFVSFCKQKVVTLEDVINGNYSKSYVQSFDTDAKYAMISGLSQVDEKNMLKVREFVEDLGAEYVALFDSLWLKNDPNNPFRIEAIQEIRKRNAYARMVR